MFVVSFVHDMSTHEKITNRLVSNSVVRIAIVVTPVVVSSFYKEKKPQVLVHVYMDILKNANI